MHYNDLNHEILKLIKEQPEISDGNIARTLSITEDVVKARISSLRDVREKILIMSNEDNNYGELQKELEAENYNVVNIPNNLPVLKTISEERPDLVLLDTASLDKEGFEICRQLKMNPKCWWVPIMLLSEKNRAEDSVKAFKSGADDYIAVPFNSLELKARIGMVLRRSRT